MDFCPRSDRRLKRVGGAVVTLRLYQKVIQAGDEGCGSVF